MTRKSVAHLITNQTIQHPQSDGAQAPGARVRQKSQPAASPRPPPHVQRLEHGSAIAVRLEAELWNSAAWEIPVTRLRRACPDHNQVYAAPFVTVPDVDVRFDDVAARWHIRPLPTHPMWAIGIGRVLTGLADGLSRAYRYGWLHLGELFIHAVELLAVSAVRDRELGNAYSTCEYCALSKDSFCRSCGNPLIRNVPAAERAQFLADLAEMWRLQGSTLPEVAIG